MPKFHKRIFLCICFMMIVTQGFAEVVCPHESLVKRAQLDFPLPIPDIGAPWKAGYLVMGHLRDKQIGWYVFDGVFKRSDTREEIISKGQDLLAAAKEPLGPYTGYITGMHYCIYHTQLLDPWDRRPKFIVAVNASEGLSAKQIMQLMSL